MISTLRTLFVAALLAQQTGCHATDAPAPEKKPPLVRVERAEPASAMHNRTFQGLARAENETKLSFKVSGTLAQVLVAVGSDVRRGQPLARLEATDYQLKQGEATAGQQQAVAQLDNAQAQLTRISALYASDSASRQDLDAMRLAVSSAQANLQAAQKRVELTRSQVGYTLLQAPFSGRVSAVDGEPGENVAPGHAIVTLTEGDGLEVEVAVPESIIPAIRVGTLGRARFTALPAQTFQARVTEVGVTTGRTATTYPVVLELVDPNPQIRAGMAAEVELEFETGTPPRAVLVAARAVGEDERGRHVWVATSRDDGTTRAQRRPVQTGALTGDELVVNDGLEAGEFVITAGLTYLRDNLLIRLPDDARGGHRDVSNSEGSPSVQFPPEASQDTASTL